MEGESGGRKREGREWRKEDGGREWKDGAVEKRGRNEVEKMKGQSGRGEGRLWRKQREGVD